MFSEVEQFPGGKSGEERILCKTVAANAKTRLTHIGVSGPFSYGVDHIKQIKSDILCKPAPFLHKRYGHRTVAVLQHLCRFRGYSCIKSGQWILVHINDPGKEGFAPVCCIISYSRVHPPEIYYGIKVCRPRHHPFVGMSNQYGFGINTSVPQTLLKNWFNNLDAGSRRNGCFNNYKSVCNYVVAQRSYGLFEVHEIYRWLSTFGRNDVEIDAY